ncbi:Sec8 exocyst complex component-specific domain-containing protein [Phascolomyces articulosus]|uniref:Exocyst complex component Sec8 n=1 Tax=Phascolomyces articulosus TaxID=60185 RepID=A0AAD5P9R1_9FUNG|nr:Sec8 exocyst complex component-specific domain-containing protein [Phascolomyces articulosus]
MDPYNQYSRAHNQGYLNGNDYNDNFSEIEAVLQEIHNGWDFMLDENFDPVTLALALMDDSSVGKEKDYKTFRRMLRNLDASLESIVDDYYKGFNNSIGTFGGVLQHINDSQDRVAQMKNSLRKCKGELLEKRTDLLNMWHKSEQHKEMLNLLEIIEEIRSTPEKVERLMNSKYVLSAADLLMQSTRTVNSKDMKQIGALDDIRRTLDGQKNTLYDLLIEELHNHLYLKSSFCDNRWAAYVLEQQSLPKTDHKPRSFTNTSQQNPKSDSNDSEENMFAVDENAILVEDTEKNPETDSYYYMEIIMESLAILGDIPPAMETVKERLPLEIHRLVDKTINEVEERRANSKEKLDRQSGDVSDIYCLDRANNEAKTEILKDLLWTLYSKLEAVLRGFRFTETCARRIKKRLIAAREFDGTQDTFRIYHFHEIWRPVQAEIRTLLQDYLSSQERTLQKKTIDINFFTFSRDKNKPLFSFTESPQDQELDQAYQRVQSNLYSSLKKQVPGFDKDFINSDSVLHSSIIDKYASDMAYRGHKLLIKPDAYNVSVLLQPTMAFLVRLRQVFPSYDDTNAEGFGSFLDDFAINVFLPQIEEKVMQLISHATVGMDAFQDDRNYMNLSKYPIVKSAVALISLIQSLCRTMHSMPFHTDEYIRMIEVVLLKYYEKCYQRFYSTVARGGSSDDNDRKDTREMDISTSGDWAQDENLIGLLAQNPYFNDDTRADFEFVKALNQTEITMEFKLKEERTFDTEELIFESKRLVALGRLYHSLKWFVREIWELRVPNQQLKLPSLPSGSFGNADFENEPGLPDGTSSRRWSTAGHDKNSLQDDSAGPILLPLKNEAARRFDTLLTTYQQLAETCLFTLRLENRCHVIYYLEMAMQEGNYYLEDETYEPDPYIITLNQDLVEVDDCITASLPPKDELFAFDGLPALIVHILISEASHIKRMNANGVQKMMRNVLALQQNLANFVPPSQNSVMERAREYYQLFNLGSEVNYC